MGIAVWRATGPVASAVPNGIEHCKGNSLNGFADVGRLTTNGKRFELGRELMRTMGTKLLGMAVAIGL
ncbi:MAG TPA: hypothetical protein VLA28_04630, partial [Afifellaceae bacterium]|nr:hypothetical protein [Afifellaceae bacterium]